MKEHSESFPINTPRFWLVSFQAATEQRIQFREINAPKVILKSTFTVSYF